MVQLGAMSGEAVIDVSSAPSEVVWRISREGALGASELRHLTDLASGPIHDYNVISPAETSCIGLRFLV